MQTQPLCVGFRVAPSPGVTASRHRPGALQNTYLNAAFSTCQPAELEPSTGVGWGKHSRAGSPGSQTDLWCELLVRIFSFALNRGYRDNHVDTSLLGVCALDTSGCTCWLHHQSFAAVGSANALCSCSKEPAGLWVRLLIANPLGGRMRAAKEAQAQL